MSHQRVSQIDQPLTRQFAELLLIRQIVVDGTEGDSLLQDLLNTETIVLWERQVAHIVTVDELLVALDDLLEIVDRVALVWSEVRVAVHGEEHVPEKNVRSKFTTYTSRLERYLEANI